MKLGIVSAYPPSKVTLNEYAYHLVKHFRQLDEVTEIVLFTNVTQDEADTAFEEEGCQITIVPCWKFDSYKTLFTVMRAVSKNKPDALLYNLQFMKFGGKKVPAALGLFLPWFTKIMCIPTIVLLHNIMETIDLTNAGFSQSKLKSWIYGNIGTFLTSVILKADKVAVTIEQYVLELEKKYWANNVALIPHGTFEIPKTPSFERHGDTFKVMTFGKFGTYKKVEDLIEAVGVVRSATNSSIQLTIAGTDNPNTPGYLDSVKSKYKNVPDLVFTGYVEEEEVPSLFNDSDVVVFPYTSTTGSSGVLHQAGSYGKAVVMPNIGDLARLVNDEGYRGEFFEPSNPLYLARAIQNLLLNDAYRKEIANANYRAASSWPMSRVVSKYMEVFKTCRPSERKSVLKTIITYFL